MKITTDTAIKAAGKPNPRGKQSFIPKHFTSSRKIGVTEEDTNDPKLMEK